MRATWLSELVASIRPTQGRSEAAVRAHLDPLTKPQGSLGRLEDLAVALTRVVGDPPPLLQERLVVVMAGDHGVTAQGVSAYPSEVTAQMCLNIAAGGAAIAVLMRSCIVGLML